MPRHKSGGSDKGFSQKAKKKQMQEKRERKRAVEEAAHEGAGPLRGDDGHAGLEDVRSRCVSRLVVVKVVCVYACG